MSGAYAGGLTPHSTTRTIRIEPDLCPNQFWPRQLIRAEIVMAIADRAAPRPCRRRRTPVEKGRDRERPQGGYAEPPNRTQYTGGRSRESAVQDSPESRETQS